MDVNTTEVDASHSPEGDASHSPEVTDILGIGELRITCTPPNDPHRHRPGQGSLWEVSILSYLLYVVTNCINQRPCEYMDVPCLRCAFCLGITAFGMLPNISGCTHSANHNRCEACVASGASCVEV